MTFTIYKPNPTSGTRSMGTPTIYFSVVARRNDRGRQGTFYANAALFTQLEADAQKLAIKKHGERHEGPIPVLILTDQDNNGFALAATVEGDPNAVPMHLNASRKATIPGGFTLASKLHIAPGAYPTTEHTDRGVTLRTITYRRGPDA